MTAQTFYLTPSLLLGHAPPDVTCQQTETLRDALELIGQGQRVLIRDRQWTLAEQILHALGLKQDAVADRIRFAHTATTTHDL
jgi:hypothetical protein